MKLLFYRYGNICEPEMLEQFTNLGIEVRQITEEITDKKMTAQRRVQLVNQELETGGFLFAFSINFFPDLSDLCEIYKLPYVCWTVDSPVVELFSKSIRNSVNHIFVFDRTQREQLEQFITAVYELPLATNVTRWDRVNSTITPEDHKKFSGDISFVGSLYTDKDPLGDIAMSDYLKGFLDGLYGMQSKLEGCPLIEKSLNEKVVSELKEKTSSFYTGFPKTVCDVDHFITASSVIGMHFSSLSRLECLRALGERYPVNLYTWSDASKLKDCKGIQIRDGVATLTEMPKVFHLSKINLNMTIAPIEKGLPLRVWDVLGCGGFLMTNYREELLDYLEPGVDCDYYSEPAELVEKCGYYLAHEEVREKIATAGYEKVKKYHTYENRMATIFKTVLEG